MDIVDHQDLAGRLEGAVLGPDHDGAGVIDLEGSARPLDLHQIGVCPPQRPAADRTVATAALGTEQGGGQSPGRRALARPRWTVQEVGVDRSSGGGAEGSDGSVLTDHPGEQGQHRQGLRVGAAHGDGVVGCAWLRGISHGFRSGPEHPAHPDHTASATSSTEPVPSTTSQAAGPAAARDR